MFQLRSNGATRLLCSPFLPTLIQLGGVGRAFVIGLGISTAWTSMGLAWGTNAFFRNDIQKMECHIG
eukprot:9111184-Alexandrium_andersonii.AAC.1